MSFLKDFKDELSQAVNELVNIDDSEISDITNNKSKEDEKMARKKKQSDVIVDDSKVEVKQDEQIVNTFDADKSEANIDMEVLNELFGDNSQNVVVEEKKTDENVESEEILNTVESVDEIKDEIEEDINLDNIDISDYLEEDETETIKDGTLLKDLAENIQSTINDQKLEEMMGNEKEETKSALRGTITEEDYDYTKEDSKLVAEEVAEVTKGTMIDGNIVSDGSMNIYGKIKGNVACRGKLVVCGTIVGSSRGAEIFTNNARIDGDVTSDGSLKIGNGSVIIGNIYGSSAVIAGAIQGDVDIHGPVIIDGTAVIQGNIRSRSVQINNGAAIEGMISQCYAEIDYAALLDKTFTK